MKNLRKGELLRGPVQSTTQDDDWTAVMVQWGTPMLIDRGDPDTLVAEDPDQPTRPLHPQ